MIFLLPKVLSIIMCTKGSHTDFSLKKKNHQNLKNTGKIPYNSETAIEDLEQIVRVFEFWKSP